VTSNESRCAQFEHDKISSIVSAMRADVVRFATFSPAYRPEMNLKTSISILLQPTLLCILGYRVAHHLYVQRWRRTANFVSRLNLLLNKASISAQSCIGPGFFLGHCAGTTFHGTAGRNLTLFHQAVCCPNEKFGGPASDGPQLGDGVTVGTHTALIGPIRVGDNVKVAPMTRLDKDCPPNKLALCARLRPRLKSPGD
jgi:serine O-acetyltransferase